MTLLSHHLVELRASGLTDETIAKLGIHSETNYQRLAAILGWRRFPKKMAPAIVFPFVGIDGANGYYRIKPDHPRVNSRTQKPIKYESPRGRTNELYLLPEVIEILNDANRELLITEGEKKAACATQYGFPTLGLVGVYGWKDGKDERLLPAMERIVWSGREVRIVFDSDASTNDDVKQAESRLADHLTKRGAKVKVVRLPYGPNGADGKPTKVGLDDFLVANHIGELRKLLDAADEAEPQEAIETKQKADKIDPATEAWHLLEKTKKKDGIPRLRFWRGAWYEWARGRYVEHAEHDARGAVVRHLNIDYEGVKRSHTSDVIDQLRAQAAISSRVEPPKWLDDPGIDWPANEVLVTQNHIVHLPSLVAGTIPYAIQATPTLFTLTALDYEFSIDATPPVEWLGFLDKLWPKDSESISALQEWFGYVLTLDTSLQKILMLIGPKRAGKGVIARVMRGVFGPDNVAGPTLAGMATNFGLWPLLGKSLAIVNDARLSGRTDQSIVVERLLSISGEDALTVDRKCLQPVTCKIPARLMIVSNELPRLSDSSGALAGRMILLQLTNSWFGAEDHGLTARILDERPGILLWAIEGWRRLRERGRFSQPKSGNELLGELCDLASPVAMFVRERCDTGPLHEVSRKNLHSAYVAWCRSKGRDHIEDDIGFGRMLRAAVHVKDSQPRDDEGKKERFYVGVGLK